MFRLPLLGVLLLLFCFTFPALGQFRFEGRVAEVEDEANLLLGSVKAGDLVTGSFHFHGGVMEQGTGESQGVYLFQSGAGITLQAGAARFGSDASRPQIRVELSNNEQQHEAAVDRFLLRSYVNLPVNQIASVEHISWQLEDESGSALASKSLPGKALDLAAWDSVHGLVITGAAAGDETRVYRVRAHVHSISLGR
jgi:hypothetical protein